MKKIITLLFLFTLGVTVTRATCEKSPQHFSPHCYDGVLPDAIAAPEAIEFFEGYCPITIEPVPLAIGYVVELDAAPVSVYLMKEAEGVRQVLVKPPLQATKRFRSNSFSLRIQNLLKQSNAPNRLENRCNYGSDGKC